MREGEADAVLRQLLVDLLVDVVEHVPVVGNLGPGAHDERHLAVVKALDGDHGRIVGLGQQGRKLGLMGLAQLLGMAALPVEQAFPPGHGLLFGLLGHLLLGLLVLLDVGIGVDDALIGAQDVEHDLAGGVHVVAVADAHAPLDAVVGLGAEVLQRTGGQAAVGDDDAVVIIGVDDGVEDLDLAHRALQLAKLDVVAHLVGLQQQDEHTAGKVLQRAAQRHADGHTGTGKDGDERAGLDAQHADDGDDEQEQQRDLDETQQERNERAVKVLAHHDGARHAVDLVDDELADVKDHDRRQDAQSQRDDLTRERGDQAAHVQILELVHNLGGRHRRDRIGMELGSQRIDMGRHHVGRLLDFVGRNGVGGGDRYLHQYLVQ